ncbi:hypothetical protein [Paenirhodobacter sp.]|uniref:hypothetical protein n=1 Tax=Paenirhodobacter sp. TaxID=1965326 RepID=UPI003B423F46
MRRSTPITTCSRSENGAVTARWNSFSLRLEGAGRFEVVVFEAIEDHSWERLVNEIVDLPCTIDLTPADGFNENGVLFFELRALTEGTLTDAQWLTPQPPLRTPELQVSVTTFRREKAVAQTAARFEAFAAQSPIGAHLRMVIVDNGQSVTLPPMAHVALVPNENLGGSGGFARGLIEAQNRGASHCLFMDDDASVHMGALERTWTFLAYAERPDVAIAGAVANAQHRWQLWENGALFDRLCRPQHMGLDLRNFGEVLELEFDTIPRQPGNFYGGWWYFAFPVDQVKHLPFPFFVRGDDVSFSLVHDFDIVTLPGVISYQDEDFSVKETPLTVYLDLRSHLAHHLALPSMEIGRTGLIRIIARFWMRSLLACHYETLDAIALACEDVLAGPEFFRNNADMAMRRQQIGALTQVERWAAAAPGARPRKSDRHRFSPANPLSRIVMKATLNGHLLPGFSRLGDDITLPASLRGARRPIWGARSITYVSGDGAKSYTVRHDKRKAWAVSRRIFGLMRQIWRGYDPLRDNWRAGYVALTERPYWEDRMGLKAEEPAA